MKQQCPKCGNWVEGKKKEDLKRKATSGAIKKGSSMATGALIGSVLPGIGTVVGGALGFAAGLIMEDDVNQVADKTNEKFFGHSNYEFTCPNCGYIWEAVDDSSSDNQVTKDQLLFQKAWVYFNENSDEIFSSVDTINAFLSEYEAKEIVSPVPKSKMDFLLAFCAYCATEADNHYLAISQRYLNRALKSNNDKEYQLFAELLNNKAKNRGSKSIVRNAIKLLGELKENQMFFKQEWYVEQLQDAIEKETHKYKVAEIQKAKSTFIMNSIFCVPILLFVIYKYAMYEVPEGFWSSVFSWVWVYWIILLTIGGIYLVAILAFFPVLSRKDEEWRELLVKQYTGFKWSDLLK